MRILLFIYCLPIIGFGQVLSPFLVSSSGNSFSSGNVIIDFSLGEIAIQTHTNGASVLTQGFHQGSLKVHTEVVNLDIQTKVYPNPTTNFLIIELEKNVNADILVYAINGRLVIKDRLKDEQQKRLDFGFLKQGNYLLHIDIKGKKNIYKIQKIK